MNVRMRLYRFLKDSPGCWVRWVLLNAVIMFACGALVVLLDLRWGSLDLRWGFSVWFGFVAGFTGVVLFNTVLELLGAGYRSWKQQ